MEIAFGCVFDIPLLVCAAYLCNKRYRKKTRGKRFQELAVEAGVINLQTIPHRTKAQGFEAYPSFVEEKACYNKNPVAREFLPSDISTGIFDAAPTGIVVQPE